MAGGKVHWSTPITKLGAGAAEHLCGNRDYCVDGSCCKDRRRGVTCKSCLRRRPRRARRS